MLTTLGESGVDAFTITGFIGIPTAPQKLYNVRSSVYRLSKEVCCEKNKNDCHPATIVATLVFISCKSLMARGSAVGAGTHNLIERSWR